MQQQHHYQQQHNQQPDLDPTSSRLKAKEEADRGVDKITSFPIDGGCYILPATGLQTCSNMHKQDLQDVALYWKLGRLWSKSHSARQTSIKAFRAFCTEWTHGDGD